MTLLTYLWECEIYRHINTLFLLSLSATAIMPILCPLYCLSVTAVMPIYFFSTSFHEHHIKVFMTKIKSKLFLNL